MCKKNYFKQLILLVSFLILVCIIFGCGKKTLSQKSKVYRVGILSGLGFFADTADGFKARMNELGYIEGKNIIYDLQKTDIDIAAYKSILKKFINDRVDLIFVFPTEASQEAKAAAQGTGIPVVFANANTEDTNLVDSVRQPGGNITGVRWPGPDLALCRFEIICKLAPQTKQIWLPYQRDYPIVKSQLETLRPAAASLGITLLEIPADDAAQLETELQKRSELVNDTDAMMIMAEPLGVTTEGFAVMGKFANEHKIPVGGTLMLVGKYESVFGFTPQNIAVGRQAAYLADKVLKGASAGTIPVVSADGYFQFNYRAAKKLGLNVPEGLLNRADEIIR